MSKQLVFNIFRFVGLLLFQVLILNQVELHGFISPFIYPLFILLLPFETPRALLMLLAFVMGLSVDVFTNTLGLHASALVFMAYCRSLVISLNRPPSGYESSDKPTMASMGFNWFAVYALMLLFLHHIFYFLVEAYSLAHLPYTLLKIVASTLISLVLVILYQYIFSDK